MDYFDLEKSVKKRIPKGFAKIFKRVECETLHPETYDLIITTSNDKLAEAKMRVFRKADNKEIDIPNGNEWFILVLMSLENKEERHWLPAATISAFLKEFAKIGTDYEVEYGIAKILRKFGYYEDILDCACTADRRTMITGWHQKHWHSTNHFLFLSQRANKRIKDMYYEKDHQSIKEIFADTDKLADLIVDTVCSITEDYRYELWYSVNDFEKRMQIEEEFFEKHKTNIPWDNFF